MIEIVRKGAHYCPRVRCDGCRGLIEDGQGNVLWEVNDDSEPTGRMVVLHKQCPDGHRDISDWLWEDLEVVLVWLLKNSGYDIRKAEKEAEFTARLASMLP